MSDLLSQSEIDALFNAVSTGEVNVEEIKNDEKKQVIREYDFARPAKFSREHLRTLELMCENFARLVSNYLSGYLRVLIPIEVVSAESMTFSEFNNSLSNPVVLGVMDVHPLDGSMLLEMSPNICYAIMDRILGGAGEGIAKIREFTVIEQIILEKVLYKITTFLKEPWENVIELRPSLVNVETNPQFVNMVAPNEMVALITFNVKFGELEGLMNLCIPHIVVEPVMDRINTRFRFEAHGNEEQAQTDKNMEMLLRKTNIPMRAVLGTTQISIQEFLDLQRNDVIKLNTEANNNIDVYVGNILKFKGAPGVYKNKSAIQIKEVILKEDD